VLERQQIIYWQWLFLLLRGKLSNGKELWKEVSYDSNLYLLMLFTCATSYVGFMFNFGATKMYKVFSFI